MFTLKNLLYIIEDKLSLDLPVKSVMHPEVTFINQDTPIVETCLFPRKRLPVLNEQGILVGMLTKSDIIRGFKAKSNHVQQQLAAVLESTPHGIIAVDKEKRVIFVNAAVEHMLKIGADQLINKLLDEAIPGCRITKEDILVKGQIIRNFQNTFNGRTYIANCAPVMDGKEIIGAVASLQLSSDIEVLAEELNVIKQLNKELATVIDCSYDGIFVSDETGRLTKLNAAAGKLLGMDPIAVLHRHAVEVASEHHLGGCVVERVMAEKKTYSTSYELHGKTIAVTGNPIFDESGHIVSVVSNVRDLTELSCLRRELKQVSLLKDMYFSELSRLKVQVASETEAFRSAEMQRVYDLALRVAVVDTPIMILGESGVGKEVLADYIHHNSLRRDQAFIKVNCAAIPESLLESELFGYAEGAFTGAKKGGKPGVFELANRGTLFLDEVGEIPANTQVKLLRAFQDQAVFKVGGSKPVKYDVRLLFATNRVLETEVSAGRFREDLYYRINVVPICIPPLRERVADITILADTFLKKFNEKYHMNKKLSGEALELFMSYNWPGNVRELSNVLERLVITFQSDVIMMEDVPRNMYPQVTHQLATRKKEPLLPLKNVLDMVEKDVIERSLKECKSLRHAARVLGVDPSTLLRKVEKYKIKTTNSHKTEKHDIQVVPISTQI